MARTPELDSGDTVEYSVTTQISPGAGLTFWIKAGGTTTVRDGESGRQAFRRLAGFVEGRLDAKVEEFNQ